jgi:ribosome modulation factor
LAVRQLRGRPQRAQQAAIIGFLGSGSRDACPYVTALRRRSSVSLLRDSYPSAIFNIRVFAPASFIELAVTRILSARSRQWSESVTR